MTIHFIGMVFATIMITFINVYVAFNKNIEKERKIRWIFCNIVLLSIFIAFLAVPTPAYPQSNLPIQENLLTHEVCTKASYDAHIFLFGKETTGKERFIIGNYVPANTEYCVSTRLYDSIYELVNAVQFRTTNIDEPYPYKDVSLWLELYTIQLTYFPFVAQ